MTGPTVIAIIGEDTAHAVLLGTLLRASIRAAAQALGRDWIIENILQDPEFRGDESLDHLCAGLRYTSSLRIDTDDIESMRIAGKRIKTRGFIDGIPQGTEAHKWRLILLKLLGEAEPDAVLVARDTDGAPERLNGLRQVIVYFESLDPKRVIVLAAPHRDAEAWFVAGFHPRSTGDAEAAGRVCRDLGFEPHLRPERLTAHPNDAVTDAKRVLRRILQLEEKGAALTPDELVGAAELLLADLSRLRSRGQAIGLCSFLDDLHKRVVPLIVPGAPITP